MWYVLQRWLSVQPPGKIGLVSLEGYFHGPMRGLLAGAEIAPRADGARVCGEPAKLIVQLTQAEYSRCPGGGDVPDSILAMLPSGVESGWASNAWSDQSFACGVP